MNTQTTMLFQRKAAKIAAITYLLTWVIMVGAFIGIYTRISVPGDAVATTRNIIAHELLFRISIAVDLLYSAGLILLIIALYFVFKSVDRFLSLLAALWRAVYALVWPVIAINGFSMLRIRSGAEYLGVFEVRQLETLATTYRGNSFDAYYVGLLFWGLSSLVCSWLWWRSKYIPRVLAVAGMATSLWTVACCISFFIFPNFANTINLWWFDVPISFFEIVTSIWILYKGIRITTSTRPLNVIT